MKVTCKSCGKRFDPDKTSYMCPKCGSWYVPQNHYDGDDISQDTIYDCDDCANKEAGSYTVSEDTIGNNTRNNTQPAGRNRKKWEELGDNKKVYTIVVGLIIVVSVFAGFIGIIDSVYDDSDNDYYVEDEYDEDEDTFDDLSYNYRIENVPVEEYAYGDRIEGCSSFGEDVWMDISSVEAVELTDADVPEGYVLYDVSYDLDLKERNSDEDYVSEDGRSYIDNQFVVYLRTKSGAMLKPIDEYDVDDMMPDDEYAENHNIDDAITATSGRLLFMVRSGDYDYMVVYSRRDNNYMDEQYDGTDRPIDKICLVGEDVSSANWYGENDSSDSLYAADLGSYVQKLGAEKKYTLPGGAGIAAEDIAALSNTEMTEDGYDHFLVQVEITNHGALEGNVDVWGPGNDSDSMSDISILQYGGLCESEVAPLSTVYSYCVVSIKRDAERNVQIVYQFDGKNSNRQIKSVSLDLPEK